VSIKSRFKANNPEWVAGSLKKENRDWKEQEEKQLKKLTRKQTQRGTGTGTVRKRKLSQEAPGF
jgi:hypothetical protein